MGVLLNEQQFIDENAKLIGERMDSPLNKYNDKSTSFVRYFHINPEKSTINDGFENVERIIGKSSPLRFNAIDNVPMLDIDSVALSLSDEEQGLDMDYEGDAIMLPGVIEPYQNDLFIINHLGKQILFMITSVEVDTVKAHNFYKVDFALRSIDDIHDNIEDQVVEEYTCIYANIGTEEKCIVKNDDLILLKKLDDIYSSILEAYRLYFYNERFNSFIFEPMAAYTVYDSYVNHFISENQLFKRKNDMSVIMTINEDYDPYFGMRYERSIFSAIERKNIKWFTNIKVYKNVTGLANSSFNHFHEKNVTGERLTDINEASEYYLDESLTDLLKKYKSKTEEEITELTSSILNKLITDYFYAEEMNFTSSDLNNIDAADFDFINPQDVTCYRLIPIVLYILRYVYKQEMAVGNL